MLGWDTLLPVLYSSGLTGHTPLNKAAQALETLIFFRLLNRVPGHGNTIATPAAMGSSQQQQALGFLCGAHLRAALSCLSHDPFLGHKVLGKPLHPNMSAFKSSLGEVIPKYTDRSGKNTSKISIHFSSP